MKRYAETIKLIWKFCWPKGGLSGAWELKDCGVYCVRYCIIASGGGRREVRGGGGSLLCFFLYVNPGDRSRVVTRGYLISGRAWRVPPLLMYIRTCGTGIEASGNARGLAPLQPTTWYSLTRYGGANSLLRCAVCGWRDCLRRCNSNCPRRISSSGLMCDTLNNIVSFRWWWGTSGTNGQKII